MNESSLMAVSMPTGLDAEAARVLRRVRRAVALGTLALALALTACVVAGWSAVTSRRAFDRRALETSGVVERVCGCTGAVVGFTTNAGQVVETRVGLHGTGGLHPGDQLLIAYDPADTTRAQVPGRRGRPYSGALVAGLYALAWGVPLLAVGLRIRKRTAGAAALASIPGAAGMPMRIVTWTQSGRQASTAASLYPDVDEPLPAGSPPVGVVTLLPRSTARRIPPWSGVEVLGSVTPGATVTIRHDGHTFLASSPVRSGDWESRRRRPRPVGTVAGAGLPLPAAGGGRMGVVTATRHVVGRVAARDPKAARRLTAALVAMTVPIPLFALAAVTLAVFGQANVIPLVALPLGLVMVAGAAAIQVIARHTANRPVE